MEFESFQETSTRGGDPAIIGSMFDRFRYPIVLRIPAAQRESALWWLLKNHPKLDCRAGESLTGALVLRVRRADAGLLATLAERLGLPPP